MSLSLDPGSYLNTALPDFELTVTPPPSQTTCQVRPAAHITYSHDGLMDEPRFLWHYIHISVPYRELYWLIGNLESVLHFTYPDYIQKYVFSRFLSINDCSEFFTPKYDQLSTFMLLFRFFGSSEWKRLSESRSKQVSADTLVSDTPRGWPARLDVLFLQGSESFLQECVQTSWKNCSVIGISDKRLWIFTH